MAKEGEADDLHQLLERERGASRGHEDKFASGRGAPGKEWKVPSGEKKKGATRKTMHLKPA